MSLEACNVAKAKGKKWFDIKVYVIKANRKKRKRTGGEQKKADLSAKDKRTAAITRETAQLCGIPPRNEGESDAISTQQ